MNIRIVLVTVLFVAISAVASFTSFKASASAATAKYGFALPTPVADASKTVFAEYRGITVGMPMAEARAKLGEPKEKSDQQDYYVFSDGESTQVVYDTQGKVRTISTSYFGDKVKAPTAKDVLGTDVEAGADGAINKLVKFPKAGIWISYVRTGGSDPMVMVTIQRMYKDES
jgi:hypothetical protein